jgi:hypothetical protein
VERKFPHACVNDLVMVWPARWLATCSGGEPMAGAWAAGRRVRHIVWHQPAAPHASTHSDHGAAHGPTVTVVPRCACTDVRWRT